MKPNEKKIILILIIIIVIVIGVVFVTTRGKGKEETENRNNMSQETTEEEMTTTLEDGTKINTSLELSNEKKFEGLTIKNIQLTNKDNKTELIADIGNTSNSNKEAMLVDVVLLDKEGKEIGRIGGRISPIRVGQTMQFSTSSMKDYSSVYDFKFELKK